MSLGNGSNESTTTSESWPSQFPSPLPASKIAYIIVGVIGALTNGIVLLGFGQSGQSKMTSTMIHIANHTTLDLNIRHFRPLPDFCVIFFTLTCQ